MSKDLSVQVWDSAIKFQENHPKGFFIEDMFDHLIKEFKVEQYKELIGAFITWSRAMQHLQDEQLKKEEDEKCPEV